MRRVTTVAIGVVAATTMSGCSADNSSHGKQPHTGGRVTVSATPVPSYTSKQLKRALLTSAAGFGSAGEVEAGVYRSLPVFKAISKQDHGVTYDKPQCVETSAARNPQVRAAQAAAAEFTVSPSKGNAEELLVALHPAAADTQVTNAVFPAECRTLRSTAGGRTTVIRTVEAPAPKIGIRARLAEQTYLTGDQEFHRWYVAFRANGYFASLSVNGPDATRQKAINFANEAYQKARQMLQ